MKKIYAITVILAIQLYCSKSNAQVQSYLNQVQLPNQSSAIIPPDGTINLYTNSTVRLNCRYGGVKTNNLVITGTYNIVVGLFSSDGTLKTRYNTQDGDGDFIFVDASTGVSGTLSKDIDTNNINYYGDYLQCKIVRVGAQVPVYLSEKYYFKRTPTYTLTSNSSNVQCGTTTPARFTANSAAASGNTYNWSIGAGWKYNGNIGPYNIGSTGTNYIDVVPTSGTLGQVTCVASFQGQAVTTLGATLNYVPFISTATISGANAICPPSTTTVYTISNVGVGNTVTWSSTNTAVATISNATSTQVTVNKVSFGTFSIKAIITNSCGQTSVVSKSVKIINPVLINTTTFAVAPYIRNEYCDTKWHYVEIDFPYQTGVTRNFISVTPNSGTLPGTTQAGVIFKLGKAFSGQFFYDINFSNGCVGVDYASEDFPPLMIRTCAQLPQGRTSNPDIQEINYKVYPNPSKDIITIETESKESKVINATLYDMFGLLKDTFNIMDNKAIRDVKQYPKGIYVLKINNDGIVENHQIIVE
jgi:Secretion system C-terminal sorting domain/PKD-like domain